MESLLPRVGEQGLYALVLVSWNIAGRKSRLDEQADRLLALQPEIMCLQQVTPVTAAWWLERLAAGASTARWHRCPRLERAAGRWRC